MTGLPITHHKNSSRQSTVYAQKPIDIELPSPKPTVRLPHNHFTENHMAPTFPAQNLHVAYPS